MLMKAMRVWQTENTDDDERPEIFSLSLSYTYEHPSLQKQLLPTRYNYSWEDFLICFLSTDSNYQAII